MWRNGYPSALFVGMQIGTATMKNMWSFLKNLKIKLPWNPGFSIPGYLSEENKNTNLNDICTLTFTAALFTIAKVCKQPKCPLIDEWIYTHTHTQIYTYTSTHTR